jgi:hypothetical protein
VRRRFRDTFEDVTVPNKEYIVNTVEIIRQTWTLLDNKEPNQEGKCSLKGGCMKPSRGLNILPEELLG